ncbi:MAG: acyltransferase [Verrucomicrobiota bacterium]
MKFLPALLRIYDGIFSRLRNEWYGWLGVRLDGYVWLRRISIPRNWEAIYLGRGVALDDGVVLLCSNGPDVRAVLKIGSGTYVNRYTMLDASERIEIGSNCMIGPHCYITDHDHAHEPDRLIKDQPLVGKAVRIGDDVWVGAGVMILKGVVIGERAVIGAGSVVTKDVAAGAKVVGVPARMLGFRG